MLRILKIIAADWRRYFFVYDLKKKDKNLLLKIAILFHNPNMLFILMYRIESYLFNHKLFIIRLLGYLLYPLYFYIIYFIFDIYILPKATIGKGLYIHYRGVVIANSAEIGENLTIIGPITIGSNFFDKKRAAVIGNNVTIGVGARVIGNITIGDNVIIGANSVVVKDVPSNVIIGGVPAKILKKNHSNKISGIPEEF